MRKAKEIAQKLEDIGNPLVKVEFAEEEVKELVNAIKSVSKAMKSIQETRLKRETLVALIAHKSKLSQGTIELVLNNLERFEETWLKPVSK